MQLNDRIILPQGRERLPHVCEKNARLHAKGESEDRRRRGVGARHRGMACHHRVGVAVEWIITAAGDIPGTCSIPDTSGTLFYPGELRIRWRLQIQDTQFLTRRWRPPPLRSPRAARHRRVASPDRRHVRPADGPSIKAVLRYQPNPMPSGTLRTGPSPRGSRCATMTNVVSGNSARSRDITSFSSTASEIQAWGAPCPSFAPCDR
jgi:hypothetical protein